MSRKFVPLALALLLLPAGVAFAAQEGQSEFMRIWATSWRIINFFILAFFLYKLAKEPLKKLLSDRRSGIDTQIKKAQKLKEEAEAEYRQIEKKMAELDKRVAEVTAMIEAQGQSQKEKIIKEATVLSERLIQEAKEHTRFELSKARQHLREELVEMAIELAEKKIKEKITAKDQERLALDYIRNIAQAA